MAFRKHNDDPYYEEDYAEEDDSFEDEEEEDGESVLDKASKLFKGLFSRKKKDDDDYDYESYDDSDAYDEFEQDFGYDSGTETAPAPATETYEGAEEYAADEYAGEAWNGESDPFYAFDEPEETAEQYEGEHVAYDEAAEDPFAQFAAALTQEAGEEYYAPAEETEAAAEEYTDWSEEAQYGDYSVFDYGEGLPEAAAEEYAAEDSEETYTGEYAEDYAGEYAEYGEYGQEYDASEYAEYAEYGEYDETETADTEAEDSAEYEDYDDYDEYGDYDPNGEEEQPSASGRAGHSSGKGFDLEKYLIPALGVIALCAVAAILFAIVTLLGTREKKVEENVPAVITPTATPTPAELQAAGAVESETPSNTVKAMRNEAGALVPVGSAVVPARGVQLDLDSFATGTHIGNSFVEGMQLWSDINTHYVCADGVSLDNMIGNYLYFVTVRNYDNIYLTLGINEIGWPTDSFIAKYEKVIDYIRSDASDYSKKATIYVTSVFPTEAIMETTAGESGQPIHKATILEFNEALKEMCERKGCWYLDVYSALAGPDGYLPENVAADDHIHFEKTGYRIWTDYLRNHYVDESMVG